MRRSAIILLLALCVGSSYAQQFTIGAINFEARPAGIAAGQTGEVRLRELRANGLQYTGWKAPDSLAANVIYTLPVADGAASTFLQTNGAGVLSWAASVTAAHNWLSTTHSDTVAGSPVLGDVPYANATPAWTKLTGNITTTRKFLRQTGTGTISAVPAWDTLVVVDIPTGIVRTVTGSSPIVSSGGDNPNISFVPIGVTGAVQFNNAGVLGGDSAFIWDVFNKQIKVDGGTLGGAIWIGSAAVASGTVKLFNAGNLNAGFLVGRAVTLNGDIAFIGGSFHPDVDNTNDIGLATRRWANSYAVMFRARDASGNRIELDATNRFVNVYDSVGTLQFRIATPSTYSQLNMLSGGVERIFLDANVPNIRVNGNNGITLASTSCTLGNAFFIDSIRVDGGVITTLTGSCRAAP